MLVESDIFLKETNKLGLSNLLFKDVMSQLTQNIVPFNVALSIGRKPYFCINDDNTLAVIVTDNNADEIKEQYDDIKMYTEAFKLLNRISD